MEHQRVQRTSNWSPTFQKRSSPSNDEPPKTVHKKTTSASPSEQLVVDKSPDPSDWLQQDPMIQQIIASDPVLGKILQQDWQPSISTEGKADTDAVGQNAVGQESIQLKRANNPTGEDSVQVQTSQLQQDSNNGSLPEVRKVANQEKSSASKIQQVAATGFRGSAASLPHLNQIQHSFGVDLSGVQAYVGGDAAAACQRMGAQAYASGNQIAFKEQPSLELAAHEAAHIVQQASGKVQLAGGVGQVGDKYENHADAVAAKVAAGESAVPLLRDFSETNSGEKQSQGRSPTDQHLTSSELSQTIENPLDQATRLIDLGVSNYYKGNYYEALKNFEKALELDPNNSRGWYNRGLPLGRLNLFKDAIDSYNKALRTDTNWGVSQPSSAWNNIGVSWYYLGEFNKSIQAFKKALEVDPNYKLAQKNHSILETLLSNNPFLRNQNQQTARPFTGEKPITSDPSWQQIVKDLLASVVQSPLHAGDVLGDIFEYLQEHWQQFVWTTVGLIAAQTSVAVLTGIPEPTFLSKVLAVALQSFLFAVYGVTIVVSVDAAINELKNWWNAASTANGNPEAIAEASRALLRMVGYILILIISSKQFQGNEKWVRLQAMLARRPEVPRGLPPGGPTIVLNKDPVTGVYRLADPNAQNPSSLPPSNRPGVNPPIQLPTRPPGGSGRSSTLTPPVTGLATPGGSTPPAPTGQIPDGGLTLKPEDRSTSIPPPPTGPATPGRSTPPASTGGIPNRGLPRKAEVRSPQVPHTSSQPVIVEELTPQTSPDPVTPNSTTFTTLPPPPASGISFRPRVTEGQQPVPSSQSGPIDLGQTPAPQTPGSGLPMTGIPLTPEHSREDEQQLVPSSQSGPMDLIAQDQERTNTADREAQQQNQNQQTPLNSVDAQTGRQSHKGGVRGRDVYDLSNTYTRDGVTYGSLNAEKLKTGV
jgi:tetratricopeptide (TPR) repeat protein